MDETRSPLVKVCGITDQENLDRLLAHDPDLIGLIFVPESPRVVDVKLAANLARGAEKAGVRAVGVFRNTPLAGVVQVAESAGLGIVQLHGREDSSYIQQLRRKLPSLDVIKAIAVGPTFSPASWEGFEREVDLLLFDTQSDQGGGSGSAFDWSILESYNGQAPFLVAGGVGVENVEKLRRQCGRFVKFKGIDINSAVEVRPGIKDVLKVAEVIRVMRDV